MELGNLINEMDHAKIDVIRMESIEKILEGLSCNLQIPRFHQIIPQEAPASIGGERNAADDISVPMYSVSMPIPAIMII